eukprot:365202-Chlamydomonas_euryale.AAC.19
MAKQKQHVHASATARSADGTACTGAVVLVKESGRDRRAPPGRGSNRSVGTAAPGPERARRHAEEDAQRV